MITRDIAAFTTFAGSLAADFGPATARAAFLVSPDGFMRAEQSAQDNRYMADAGAFDTGAVLYGSHSLRVNLKINPNCHYRQKRRGCH